MSESQGAPKPEVVSIKTALELLGGKSRSQFYVEAARGEYELFKDGEKTLVSVASINRRISQLPRARIGKPVGA